MNLLALAQLFAQGVEHQIAGMDAGETGHHLRLGQVFEVKGTLERSQPHARNLKHLSERTRKREALLPLWERHLLPGKLLNTIIRRPLVVVE